MLSLSIITQKGNILIQTREGLQNFTLHVCSVFQSEKQKMWLKSHMWNKFFWRQIIFAIASEYSTVCYGLPILIAWFIPAHLVSPTLSSLWMITVQNHLGLQNPVKSILFSPAAQGCKKYTINCLLFYCIYLNRTLGWPFVTLHVMGSQK